MRLEGKVAIVTGSAQGIGETTAILFAKEGAKVLVADFNEEKGKATVETIKANGGEADFFKIDVSNYNQAKAMVEKCDAVFGNLDILINNAGITRDGFMIKMSEEDWDAVINVNLKGVFNCSKHAAIYMMEKDGGVIINASSVVGLYGNIGQVNYAATKFGVIGMTKTLSKELGSRGVRVNAVAPGYTNTAMMDSVPDKVLTKLENKVPQKRLGETEDIANAYLYLASDEAKYVNGEILSVDGGLVLG